MKVSSSMDNVEISNLAKAKKNMLNPNTTVGRGEQAPKTMDGTAVRLSDKAKLVAKAIEIVKGTDLSNKEKVELLKKQIAANEYKPDYGEVADKMLLEELLRS